MYMKERILAYLHDVLILLAPYIVNLEPPECQKLWYGQAYLVGIICPLYPIGIVGLSNLSKI